MSDHCGRLDNHAPHEFLMRFPNWPAVTAPIVTDCPGAPVIEGGSLETHDCGARVHPDDIKPCCSRCTGTLCPSCEPCRRVS